MTLTYNVNDTTKAPSHHLMLVEGSTTVGITLKSSEDIQQQPYNPSSLQFNTGRQGYGSFEPPYTSIDQTDWSGGLGQRYFKDTSKFLDSYNAWTMNESGWLPAPMGRFARGLRAENTIMPNSTQLRREGEIPLNQGIGWTSLTGSTAYRGTAFLTTEAYSASEIWLFMRYFGNPPTLTVEIRANSSNEPGSVITNGTITTSSATLADIMPEGAGIGQWIPFNLDTAASMNNATVYHVIVGNTEAGTPSADYWEVGTPGLSTTTNSYPTTSSDGSSWSSGGTVLYFRVLAALVDGKVHFVEYKNALYACTEPTDGSAGKIYLNGDRGVATGTSTANKLVDTTQSWEDDQYINAYLHIFNGTGEGQVRRIVDSDATSLTVYDSSETETLGTGTPFDITPIQGGTDTGSEYVITGTQQWQNVTPTNSTFTITKPITDVLVLWGVLYCCQGEDANAAKLREYNDNSSPGVWFDFHGENANTHDTLVIDDANWVAQYLAKTYDPKNENFVWRARNQNPAEWTGTNQTSVSKADDVVWSANMSFGTGIPVGTRDHLITNIAVYNNLLWVGKEDSVWYIESDGTYDRAHPLQIGLEAMAEPDNNRAMVAKDLFLFFNWAHSVEKLYGSNLTDIGPWRGMGLPERARGPIVDLVPAIGWLFAAVDGGAKGQSSVLAYNDRGWHTLYRGPARGKSDFAQLSNPRIRNLHWQSVSGEFALNFLWFESGGDIMFMRMPRKALNPALDSSMDLALVSYVTSSIHDAGYSNLEKHFEQVHLSHPGANQIRYEIDYIADVALDEVMGFNASAEKAWTTVTVDSGFAPDFTFDLSQSRKRTIILRTRTSTLTRSVNPVSDKAPPESEVVGESGAGPASLEAVVLDAFARTPVKYNWTFPIVLDEHQETLDGQVDLNLETKFTRLNNWANRAQELALSSTFHWLHNKTVVIEPLPATFGGWDNETGTTRAMLSITLRET
ncbi:hypothetical protein LCGC14_0507470 [marine sediment metagenome]|uniref:Uncharacterized protein n=1 Tax=marine sediment metagenome TaxID=412755 RepID=A0A0F9S772_9ZZZZ